MSFGKFNFGRIITNSFNAFSSILRPPGAHRSPHLVPNVIRAVEMVGTSIHPSVSRDINHFITAGPSNKDGLINRIDLGSSVFSGVSPFSPVSILLKSSLPLSTGNVRRLSNPGTTHNHRDLAQGLFASRNFSTVSNLSYKPYLGSVFPSCFYVSKFSNSRYSSYLGAVFPSGFYVPRLLSKDTNRSSVHVLLGQGRYAAVFERNHSVETSLLSTNSVNPALQSDEVLSVPKDLSRFQIVKNSLVAQPSVISVSQIDNSVLSASNGSSNFQLIVGQSAKKDNVLHVCSQLAKLVELNSGSPVLQTEEDLSSFQLGHSFLDSQQSVISISQPLLNQLVTASSKTPLSFEFKSDFGLIIVSVSGRKVSLFFPESDFVIIIGSPFDQKILPLGRVHSALETSSQLRLLDCRRSPSNLPLLPDEIMHGSFLDISPSPFFADCDLAKNPLAVTGVHVLGLQPANTFDAFTVGSFQRCNLEKVLQPLGLIELPENPEPLAVGQIAHVCRTDEELSMRTILNYLHGFLQNIAKNSSEFKPSGHSTPFAGPQRPKEGTKLPVVDPNKEGEFQDGPSAHNESGSGASTVLPRNLNLSSRSTTPSIHLNKSDASIQSEDEQDQGNVESVESGSMQSFIYRSSAEIKRQLDLLLSNPKRYYSSFKSFVNSVSESQKEKSYLNDFVLMYQLDYQDELKRVDDNLGDSDAYKVVGAAISDQNSSKYKAHLKKGLIALNNSTETYSNPLVCSTCLYLSKSEGVSVSKIKDKFKAITDVELLEENVEDGIARLLAFREQGYSKRLNEQALDYIAHNKASSRYAYALCKSGLSIDYISDSLQCVYPSEFYGKDSLISNLHQLFSGTRANLQIDSLGTYYIDDCQYKKSNAEEDKDTSGFNAFFGVSQVEGQEVEIKDKITRVIGKLKTYHLEYQIPNDISRIVKGVYDDYEYVFEKLCLNGDSEFSVLDLGVKNALAFWSESLFDFMKAQFTILDPIKKETIQCSSNLEGSIDELLHTVQNKQSHPLSAFKSDGAFRYTPDELRKLCSEYPETAVSKNAQILLDVEKKEADAKQELVLNYIDTVLEHQLLQENYPFSNSELGLLFLADQLYKDSANRQRLIIYQEDGRGSLSPTTYSLDDLSYSEDNCIRIHQAGFNYSHLKKVS